MLIIVHFDQGSLVLLVSGLFVVTDKLATYPTQIIITGRLCR